MTNNAGQMTYDLRRLRLRGLIERIPHSQRYRLTAEGLCTPWPTTAPRCGVLGPVLSATLDGESPTRLQADIAAYDREVGQLWEGHTLAARTAEQNGRQTGRSQLDSTVKTALVQGV